MSDPQTPARPAPYTGGLDEQSGTVRRDDFYIGNGTGGFGFARGWVRRIQRIIKPSGDRPFVQRTEPAFQSGPGPQMIVRQFAELTGGKTGPRTSSFPATAGGAYIPGMNINRRDGGKINQPGLRTTDDGAHIPAIFAGNPPQG